MLNNIHGFDEKPPKIAYVDPSFFINLMVKDSLFFEDCRDYSEKLKGGKTVLVMSNIENIITTDSDFKRIDDLEVYTCND